MLVELRVRDLGVIESVALDLGPGMTALTGETGAGKTLLVEALELLVGGRADSGLVRAGDVEARVEGRFLDPSTDDELARAPCLPPAGVAPTRTVGWRPRPSWPSWGAVSSISTVSTSISRCSSRPASGARSTRTPEWPPTRHGPCIATRASAAARSRRRWQGWAAT